MEELIKKAEASLKAADEYWEKKLNRSFYDSIGKSKIAEAAVTTSMREEGSGDGPGKHGSGRRETDQIPLNTPDNLVNASLRLIDEDNYDSKVKVPLPELVRKALCVERLNTMLNKETNTVTYKDAYVVSICANTGGTVGNESGGSGDGDQPKDEVFVISSGVGQTANDAFKSALDTAHQQLERVSRSRAASTCGSTRSTNRRQ